MTERTLLNQSSSRLDEALHQAFPELSKSQWKRACEEGRVLVSGKPARPGRYVAPGEEIQILRMPVEPQARTRATFSMPFRVHAEDAAFIVIEKPRGAPSVTLREDDPETAADFLVSHFPECLSASPDKREGGLIHRLDTFSSGLLLAARTPEGWESLRAALHRGEIHKEYLVVTERAPGRLGQINLFLKADGKRVRVSEREQEGFVPISSELAKERALPSGWCVIRVKAPFAKRHQVRATLAFLNAPLVGDALYGAKEELPEGGFLLHATHLSFPHPRTGEPLEFESPCEMLERM